MRPNCWSSLRSASRVSARSRPSGARPLVARERRVDGRAAAHHVREDAVDDQVADDDAHRAAQERVDAAPVAARLHVPADGAQRRSPLEHHLEREQDEGASDVEPVGEERPIAGVGVLLRLHAADGQDDLLGLAGEEVAAARAAVDQEADAGNPIALDPRAVVGAEHAVSMPLSLSTQRNAGMSSLEPSRIPAWLAPVCEERSVSHPAAHACLRRPSGPCAAHSRPASPSGAREREPVDLEVDDPGHVGSGCAALAFGDALDDLQRVGVVVVRPEDHFEEDADSGDQERREQRPAEVVHHESVFQTHPTRASARRRWPPGRARSRARA